MPFLPQTVLLAALAASTISAQTSRPSPQNGSGQPGRSSERSGSPPVEPGTLGVQLDESGWPVLLEGPRDSGARFEPSPASTPTPGRQPGGALRPRPGDRIGDSAAGRDGSPRAVGDPMAPDSPLFEVFQAVGTPSAAEAIGATQAAGSLVMRDVSGRHLGTRYFVHDFDLSRAQRDRIRYEEQSDTATVYGRDTAAVFAERHLGDSVVPLPNREEASDELDLFGLLVRVPWCFADRERFRMGPERAVTVDGRNYRQLVFERVRGEGASAATDRFYLNCFESAGGLEPAELRFVLAGGDGVERCVKLTDYGVLKRGSAPVRVPMQRWVVDHEGRPLLEVVFTRITPHVIEDATLWRPGS